MEKGTIKKHTFYTVVLEDGREIPVDFNEVTKLSLGHGFTVSGHIESIEEQDQYSDDSYARSYTIIEKFIIKNFEEQ